MSYFRYDIKNNTWSSIASMPNPRSGSCLIAAQGSLYAIGGLNDSSLVDTVDRYDPLLDRWFQDVLSMQTARTYHGCAIYKGKLYVAGGYSDTSISSSERYDFATKQWTSIAWMNERRYGASCFFIYSNYSPSY